MLSTIDKSWSTQTVLNYLQTSPLLYRFFQAINGNWENHRPLLALALELTTGPVIEFGSGLGSTPALKAYCRATKRPFTSYDNNDKWAGATGSTLVTDWDAGELYVPVGLVFIDHAPGPHRRVALKRFQPLAAVIVIHDSEIGGAGDYKLEPILGAFKYRLNYNLTGGGAGVTAVSDTVPLNVFRGLKLGPFLLDNE